MHNGIFTVSEKGASRLDFHHQWEYEEAPKRKLRNPWNHRPDGVIDREEVIVEGRHMGWKMNTKQCTEEESSAWRLERDKYIRQRNEWIAMQMFHKYGYETFLSECETYGLTGEFCKSVFPCESENKAQCNLFCPIYKDCVLRLCDEGAQKGDED